GALRDERLTFSERPAPEEIASPSARLGYEHHSAKHIPCIEVHFDKAVEPPLGDLGERDRRRAVAAIFPARLEHRPDLARLIGGRRSHAVVEPDGRLAKRPAATHANGNAVLEGALPAPC